MRDQSISIIIPCYNGEKYLGEAIESVLSQNQKNAEIIVIDDGSEDSSLIIARSFKQVICISQENKGPSAARNTGLNKASGDYIGFIDADDIFPEDKLKIQIDYLNDHLDCDLVSGRIKCFGNHSDHMYQKMYENPVEKIMLGFHLGASLYRRKVFEKIGIFDEQLKYSEDVDHWFKIVEQNLNYNFLEEVTLLHRRHQSNMTNEPLSIQNTYFITSLKKSMDRRKKLGSFQMPDFFKRALQSKK